MAEEPAGPPPSVGPTRYRALTAVVAVGVLLGYGFAVVTERVRNAAPLVQWPSVLALLAIAALLAAMALSTYRLLHRDRRRLDPQRAVMFLMLAKASSLVGALLAGGYAGFALHFIDSWEAELPRERVIRGASAAVAGVTVVIAGLLLERACRIPKDPED